MSCSRPCARPTRSAAPSWSRCSSPATSRGTPPPSASELRRGPHLPGGRDGRRRAGRLRRARRGRQPPGAEAEIHTIGVDPAHQGRGIGRALLRGLLAAADTLHATVFLEVRTDNDAGPRALRDGGLRRGRPAPHYYRPSGADAYTMRRERRDGRPLVLGIETSCDETGVGIVRSTTRAGRAARRRDRLQSVDEHARFGGVVPEVASPGPPGGDGPDRAPGAGHGRGHARATSTPIAVTAGPGLAGALLVGVAAAKAYAAALDVPLYGVNHLAAHVAVDTLEHGPLPAGVALLVSGGHSPLLRSPDLAGGVRRSAPPSTTPRARRSTRSPACSACRSRAARRSTGPRATATRRRSRSRAGSPARATPHRSTSRSPG